jgi:hypothetical protein
VGNNHLPVGFVLMLKYLYFWMYMWLYLTTFNDKNFACSAHVRRMYGLVFYKWKYFDDAGWILRTAFNVRWVTYQYRRSLGAQLLKVYVAKDGSDTRKAFRVLEFQSTKSLVIFKGFIFRRNPNKYASYMCFHAPNVIQQIFKL